MYDRITSAIIRHGWLTQTLGSAPAAGAPDPLPGVASDAEEDLGAVRSSRDFVIPAWPSWAARLVRYEAGADDGSGPCGAEAVVTPFDLAIGDGSTKEGFAVKRARLETRPSRFRKDPS